jgi:protein involved in polysaccharide export with SLBB domain
MLRLQLTLSLASLLLGCAGWRSLGAAPSDRTVVVQGGGAGAAARPAEPTHGTLGSGDVFHVRVFREASLSGDFMVGADGSIQYPLLGVLRVEGLTTGDVATKIRSALAGSYLKEPHVTVLLKETKSKRVLVLGQVQKPGTFAFLDDMTIVEAITLAGGFTKIAAPDAVQVTRMVDGEDQTHTVALDRIVKGRASNFGLAPGDIVFVPESIF